MIYVIELVIWVIAGILVLLNGRDPTKFEYVLVWGCLLLTLVGEIINKRL